MISALIAVSIIFREFYKMMTIMLAPGWTLDVPPLALWVFLMLLVGPFRARLHAQIMGWL